MPLFISELHTSSIRETKSFAIKSYPSAYGGKGQDTGEDKRKSITRLTFLVFILSDQQVYYSNTASEI